MADPVCSTCLDTHRMTLSAREILCTHCPTPCENCRTRGPGQAGGPYCATTPCACACHGQRAVRPDDFTDLELTLYAAGTDDSVTSRMAREIVRLRAANGRRQAHIRLRGRRYRRAKAELDAARSEVDRLRAAADKEHNRSTP